ncbi:MAG TPA: ABC transporter permease [Candidatus Methylomirabilis sp.]|nr:ABC transporter permease [Candidatus Methylomirabilis sp.]
MRTLRAFFLRLANLFRNRRANREFSAELESHLRLHVEENLRSGMSPTEARRHAFLKLGGLEQTKLLYRDRRALPLLQSFVQDVSYGLRILRKSPGFTGAAVLTLGLAIGVNTAIFSIVNAVLLRPLPYPNPARLVAFSGVYQPGKLNQVVPVIAATQLEEWRKENRLLESMAAFTFTALPMRAGNEAYYPSTGLVDPEFLATLGISPILGRDFAPFSGDAKDLSAILTYKFWMQVFGGDPSAMGKPLIIDGDPFTVVGVLPPTFQFPRSDAAYSSHDVEVLVPAKSCPGFPRYFRNWFGIGRLRDNVTLAQAQSEMLGLAERTAKTSPNSRDWSVRLDPLDKATTFTSRRALLLTFGISMVLLVIACTNLMNLFFSRSSARSREMALRRAIGASSGRLIRQLLTESACLAAFAGLVGLALASVSLDAVARLSPLHLPVSGKISLDPTVLAFTSLICAFATVLAGLLPALRSGAQREALLSSSGTRVHGSKLFVRAQRTLAVAQIALGLGLLAVAGLLVNSLWRLSSVDPGFVHQGILGFTISVPQDRSDAQRVLIYQRLLTEIRNIPGVSSAGMVTFLPPEPISGVFGPLTIADRGAEQPPEDDRFVNTLVTSDGYFQTLGIPILQGRDLTPRDTGESGKVVIVNETLARRFFPQGNVLGRRVRVMFDGDGPPREIIGVAKDVRDRGLGSLTVPTAYTPMTQFSLPYGSVAVRARVPLAGLISQIRDVARKVDSSTPLADFQSLDARIYASLQEPRFYTALAGVCAFMAVLFVTIGLYGLIAFSVSQRIPEIGIRLALGAQRASILRMVLGQGLRMVALGVAIGLVLALAFTRLLQNLLFEIQPTDLPTLAAVALLLTVVTLLASYVPALRATRVDPVVALRCD